MLADDWTPHHRDDGELLGRIFPAGKLWQAVDVLGRIVDAPGEWLDAEAALEEHGLGWLPEPWILEQDGAAIRVRFLEVSPATTDREGRIVVKLEDFGAVVDKPTEGIVLAWPVPAGLREPLEGDPDGYTFG